YYDVRSPARQPPVPSRSDSTRACARRAATAATSRCSSLDLDRFKEINDNFADGEGDRLLRLVAERVMGCVAGSDAVSRPSPGIRAFTVSRQGGDEFTVMLTRPQP
ncbi:MAG: diguanylate cyclase, partial [Deltaproteobacteria bacterium]|nr:diguanylate cyclase [Deltaproteobacteria bacterium]